MTDTPDALRAIASPPPQVPIDRVLRVVNDDYGLDGELVPLLGERDQNFRLTLPDKGRFVVKIANAVEAAVITDLQVRALQHLELGGCPIPVPRVLPTRSGDLLTRVSTAGDQLLLRIISYLPGQPLEDITPDAELARSLGRSLAEVDIALRDFEHPGDSQPLLWDMQRAPELRNLTSHIADAQLRSTVCDCLHDFVTRAAPRLAALRSQIIHNDLNPGNVLVTPGDSPSVAGVIDFGDMIRAPLIIDVAVAAAYVRDDALALLPPFVAGYHAVTQLDAVELELLYDLMRTRLAISLTILHWRISVRAEDDAYTALSRQDGESAERFLASINAIPRSDFRARLLSE